MVQTEPCGSTRNDTVCSPDKRPQTAYQPVMISDMSHRPDTFSKSRVGDVDATRTIGGIDPTPTTEMTKGLVAIGFRWG